MSTFTVEKRRRGKYYLDPTGNFLQKKEENIYTVLVLRDEIKCNGNKKKKKNKRPNNNVTRIKTFHKF